MTGIYTVLVLGAVVYGALQGTLGTLGTAAMAGAQEGIRLAVTLAGPLCLWCGLLKVMEYSGSTAGLGRLLRPFLRRLLPRAGKDEETLVYLSGNMAANLLGLGNAATPLGIRATERMARHTAGTADDELCRLVVLNTASIQLLPTTVAALRAGYGCATPFDILPCVWISSAASVTVGLVVVYLAGKVWPS